MTSARHAVAIPSASQCPVARSRSALAAAGWTAIAAISAATWASQPQPARSPLQPAPAASAAASAPAAAARRTEWIRTAVDQLLSLQEPDGDWPYEGVYRVAGEIPIGYRIGGTAIVCEALVQAAEPDHAKLNAAVARGVEFILRALDDPLMQPSRRNAYDVRVWGHAYALNLFCLLRNDRRFAALRPRTDERLPWLVNALLVEELTGGGWNYATRRAPASFVTAPVAQALLRARAAGQDVPDDVLLRCRDILERARLASGAVRYAGVRRTDATDDRSRDTLPGSAARAAVCEATLTLLGGSSPQRLEHAVQIFFTHWDELEKRRRRSGTHAPPHGIAPYYVYYGHRYAAQAIELLPPPRRDPLRARLADVIARTRDPDGTWNDRVFERSRNFGTAMVVLSLLGGAASLPPPVALGEPPKAAPASQPAPHGTAPAPLNGAATVRQRDRLRSTDHSATTP